MRPEIEIDPELFLIPYRHLQNTDADINFIWGGRDSGKSHDVAQRKIIACIQQPYFREILIKKTSNSIKDSQWQTIKDICSDWGIEHFFDFTTHPLEIRLKGSENKFIARGCDDPGKLKSIRNPSGAWIEEGNQLTEDDWIIVLTTIRNDKGSIKIDVTFNPEAEGSYEEFWLYKSYFKDNFEKGIVNFTGFFEFTMPDKTTTRLKYTSTHTTYKDNEHVPAQRIAIHESLKKTNPYYYKVFTLGMWGQRNKGGEFYKCYAAEKHIGISKYNPLLPIHLTFDFNVNPYMTGCVWQVNGKHAGKIAEILLPHPRNTSAAICGEFIRLFPAHNAGLFIYGDPGGLKQSTADDTMVRVKEKDYSEFNKIDLALAKYNPQRRVPRSYPAVKLRGDFVNTIFELNFDGITIVFDESCKVTHQEYSNLKEASDGTKHKEMYKDPNTEVQCQKWGHISDADDYFITSAFNEEFYKFQTGGNTPSISVGQHQTKNKW